MGCTNSMLNGIKSSILRLKIICHWSVYSGSSFSNSKVCDMVSETECKNFDKIKENILLLKQRNFLSVSLNRTQLCSSVNCRSILKGTDPCPSVKRSKERYWLGSNFIEKKTENFNFSLVWSANACNRKKIESTNWHLIELESVWIYLFPLAVSRILEN